MLKKATQCHNYESLAQCILDAVKSYSDSAIIEMKGAGLGLYYVHSFSKQLDGDIGVKSVENEGSVFTLTLPKHSPKVLDNVELF